MEGRENLPFCRWWVAERWFSRWFWSQSSIIPSTNASRPFSRRIVHTFWKDRKDGIEELPKKYVTMNSRERTIQKVHQRSKNFISFSRSSFSLWSVRFYAKKTFAKLSHALRYARLETGIERIFMNVQWRNGSHGKYLFANCNASSSRILFNCCCRSLRILAASSSSFSPPIDSNIFSSWIRSCWILFISTHAWKKFREVQRSLMIVKIHVLQCSRFSSVQDNRPWRFQRKIEEP